MIYWNLQLRCTLYEQAGIYSRPSNNFENRRPWALGHSLPMPVSPRSLSGISACHFWTFLSLEWLGIFLVGPATFKSRRTVQYETTKTPSLLQACSFFSNPFLEFCLSTPTFSKFSSITLFHIFVQAFDTLEIPKHRFGTQDTLKKVICLSILQAFFSFSCNAIFRWIWTYETHDLNDCQLTVGSFVPAISFMWSD